MEMTPRRGKQREEFPQQGTPPGEGPSRSTQDGPSPTSEGTRAREACRGEGVIHNPHPTRPPTEQDGRLVPRTGLVDEEGGEYLLIHKVRESAPGQDTWDQNEWTLTGTKDMHRKCQGVDNPEASTCPIKRWADGEARPQMVDIRGDQMKNGTGLLIGGLKAQNLSGRLDHPTGWMETILREDTGRSMGGEYLTRDPGVLQMGNVGRESLITSGNMRDRNKNSHGGVITMWLRGGAPLRDNGAPRRLGLVIPIGECLTGPMMHRRPRAALSGEGL